MTPDDVLAAALEVLEERGLDGVSTRAVANRLDVRMNTVLWHVKTKAGLLDLMADAIVGEVALDDLAGDWRDRAVELMRRLRLALLSHRDGALVVSGTFPALPRTLRLADTLLATLLDGARDARTAAWTAWALVYFTLGLVQEEQQTPALLHDAVAREISPTTYPALSAVLDEYAAADFTDRFEYGAAAILAPLDSPAAKAAAPARKRR
nr:TetR/AcrR family transcriptional regulator C-terminal domain-containing protein [Conexibacter arvalis]